MALGFARFAPNKDIGAIWRGAAQWQVVLVARNKTLRMQMRGDAQRAGLFGMMSVAASALHGFVIGNLGSAHVSESGPVYSDNWANKELAVGGLTVSVPFTLTDTKALSELDDLLRVGVTWEGKAALPEEVINVRDA